MPEIRVREAAGAEDVAVVRRLMRAYGEHLAAHPAGAANICIEGYERELARLPEGYAALLVAFVDGEPAGCAALRMLTREEQACELKRLWVDPSFRGLGLGRTLVNRAIDWAERKGSSAIYLDTVPEAMPEASQLYKSMGFVQVERYNQNPLTGVAFFRRGLSSPKGDPAS